MKFFPESLVPDPDKKFNQSDYNLINKIIEKLLQEDKDLDLYKNDNFEGSPSRVIREINQSDIGEQMDVFFSKNEKLLNVSFRKFSSYNNREFHTNIDCVSFYRQYLECLHPEIVKKQTYQQVVKEDVKINKLIGIQIIGGRNHLWSDLCVGSVEDDINTSNSLNNCASKKIDIVIDIIREKFKI